ncbi:hypothetical protein TRVA0_012S02498 [Trichomonascus vanleenenianus]|uniref:Ids2p n=1 Tax=Trichomonascus vanleenenianus TaxID=2268995 RepID=UPI003EC9715E
MKKSWVTLLTNDLYLVGVLTLEHSLRQVDSRYPFLVIYTDSVSRESINKIRERGVECRRVDYLMPKGSKDYSSTDSRFNDTWTKLQAFELVEYDQLVLLDSDMVVVRNMDELLDQPIVTEEKPLAACHACVCNPYKKPHYPKSWVPENCAYTHYQEALDGIHGPDGTHGLQMMNSGLLVFKPSLERYAKIIEYLGHSDRISQYIFPDQELLCDVFGDTWVGLSYKYNALKTLKQIHRDVWDDRTVKNIHYIITPKPWEVDESYPDETDTFKYWFKANRSRLRQSTHENHL